jgi:hypothetical protein
VTWVDASGSATRHHGRYRCTGASSCTRSASLSCMMARAVNDLVTEPIRNGVCGVTSGPDSSASPKPCTCTIRSRCTMPSAKPGMRCTSISERTYRSMAARSGPPSAAAVADPSIADTMPQANAASKRITMGERCIAVILSAGRYRHRFLSRPTRTCFMPAHSFSAGR